MSIQMQVVGIFFRASLPLTSVTSVRDVLVTAQREAAAGSIPGVRSFDFRDDGKVLIAARAIYTAPVQGRATGRVYPPGEYYLAQNSSALPAYSQWQYYVLDENGRSTTDGGVRLLDSPKAVVPANGTLIWRLVNILAGPNPAPRSVISSLES